jgi:hypothetical protein
MNKVLKIASFSLLLLVFAQSFGQVTVAITNMTYNSGTPISNCGNIDFGTNSTVSVQFGIALSKSQNFLVGNGTLYVYAVGTSGNRIELSNEIVQSVSFNTSYTSSPPTLTMNASDFSTSGGTLFAVFKSSSNVEYSSCTYSITKTQVPTFNLSPSSLSVACGSPATFQFTVLNQYNSPGTVTYKWTAPGWSYNSVPVGNSTITTNINTITLKLTGCSYSNVKVIPVLNGVAYPQKTATINLSNYSTPIMIMGYNTLCNLNSSYTYTLTNAMAENVTTVWTSSNPAIASVTGETNSQVTINAHTQGMVTLRAQITNCCGQTTTKQKIIKVGNSIPNFNIVKSTEFTEICGNDFHYVFVDVINPDTSASTYTYVFSGFITGISNPNVTYVQISPTRYRMKIPKNKITIGPYPVLTFNVVCTNECNVSTSIYGKTITLNAAIVANCGSGTPPLPGGVAARNAAPEVEREHTALKEKTNESLLYSVYPNPASDIVAIALKDKSNVTNSDATTVAQLYDLKGQRCISTQVLNNVASLNVSDLQKGVYILKISVNGKIESHQVIVK